MPISRARLIGAGALTLSLAAAAWAQQKPVSILPPGFDEPTPAPAPSASGTPRATPTAATPGATVQPLPPEAPIADASPSPDPTPSDTPTPDAALLAQYELPDYARHSLDRIGVGDDRAIPASGFGSADGRWLEALMRRTRAPIASRWLAITLRRMLVSPLDTPARVDGADFAAERAWLLLRMGESVAARAVVQAVDPGDVTPKLYQIAMQAALATSDPAAVCPLVKSAGTDERAWVLAKPMCLALSGSPQAALPLLTAARRQHVAGGIDYQLAQKVVGVGGQGRQAVTIEWDNVDQLTAWRFGLATATGVEIPDSLYDTVGGHVAGWRALSPAIPIAQRLGPAENAAERGILSSAALVDLYAAAEEADDESAGASSIDSDLRDAYAERSTTARRAALQRLWNANAQGRVPYARLILTAGAAARVTPASDDADADRLVAAMLSAGLDRTAERWRTQVAVGGDAWAMLLLADPDPAGPLPYSTLGRYAPAGDATRKQRMFVAAMAGLGRLSPEDAQRAAQSYEVRVGAANSWTRAIDRAARDDQPATVVLLAAIGLQTGDWRGVPPEALYHILSAMSATGLDGPARMIAAEAIARA